MTPANLPPSASRVVAGANKRLIAPSAERNRDAILAVLQRHAPESGRALELASGTGQHISHFASCLPNLVWQPTEVDVDRIESIKAWRAASGCDNLLAPQILDATRPGWAREMTGYDLVYLVNLLHLISKPGAQTVITEACRLLNQGGVLLAYGPFLRDGRTISAGDRAFDAELRAADPDIGYKDATDIAHWMQEAGLEDVAQIEMPANNLVITGTRR
ncbi:MAG: DUF938 domain-containing protein [Pseudomonadota bacterium]